MSITLKIRSNQLLECTVNFEELLDLKFSLHWAHIEQMLPNFREAWVFDVMRMRKQKIQFCCFHGRGIGPSIQLHSMDTLILNQALVVLNKWTDKVQKLLWPHRLVIVRIHEAVIEISLPGAVHKYALDVEADHVLEIDVCTEWVCIADVNAFDFGRDLV